eukprot:56702-Prorocentrum_lima.AAC.1
MSTEVVTNKLGERNELAMRGALEQDVHFEMAQKKGISCYQQLPPMDSSQTGQESDPGTSQD